MDYLYRVIGEAEYQALTRGEEIRPVKSYKDCANNSFSEEGVFFFRNGKGFRVFVPWCFDEARYLVMIPQEEKMYVEGVGRYHAQVGDLDVLLDEALLESYSMEDIGYSGVILDMWTDTTPVVWGSMFPDDSVIRALKSVNGVIDA